MRKVRLVKVVIPEIVAYMGSDPDINNMEQDYQCPECGFGIAHAYMFCPYCGAELDWRHARTPSERFIKIGGTIAQVTKNVIEAENSDLRELLDEKAQNVTETNDDAGVYFP